MTDPVIIFVAALVLAVAGTPVARRIAVRLGFMDAPSARKVHTAPMPLLGGLAIYAAFILALLLTDQFYVSQLVGILIGATLVSFLGVWDDRMGLGPLLKLAGQFLAALVLIATGVKVDLLPYPYVDELITVFWVVGITNALNLVDNMDGLSSGVAAVASGFFFLLAAMSKQYLVSILAAALLGASLGFLRYNFNPATIFMGDTGSLFLGFVLAAVGIKLRFPDNVPTVTWMIPVMVLGLPIFDTTLVVVSRFRRRVPFYLGAKDHISHRLVMLGFTRREAVMALYLACFALGALAIFLTQASVPEAYVVGVGSVLFALYALWRLEEVDLAQDPKGLHTYYSKGEK